MLSGGKMAKKETVYDVAFKIYEIPEDTGSDNIYNKERMRYHIRELLKKKYPDKTRQETWANFSSMEKDCFVYIDIRNIMLKYVHRTHRDHMEAKLDNLLRQSMLHAAEEIDEYNNNMLDLYKRYYNDDISLTEKHSRYKLFCQSLLSKDKTFPIPDYDTWVEENKDYALTIHDYLSRHDEHVAIVAKQQPTYQGNLQSDIDHLLIQIIVKILSDKFNVEIDIPHIKECLEFVNDFPIEPNEPLQSEINADLTIPEDEQNIIIENNKKFVTYKNRLADLDYFYKVIDEND